MLEYNDIILFQGDSITHAFRKQSEIGTSYQLGAGWVMMTAARMQAQYPQMNLRVLNRGECGHGVEALLERWDRDCLSLRPTVLSLLVGVNETIDRFLNGRSLPVAAFRDAYTQLLMITRQALPDIRLVLCEPFLLEVGAVTSEWLNDLHPRRQVVRDLAVEFGAVHVPFQDVLNRASLAADAEHWLFDGIHPNAAGQWLLMDAWIAAVRRQHGSELARWLPHASLGYCGPDGSPP